MATLHTNGSMLHDNFNLNTAGDYPKKQLQYVNTENENARLELSQHNFTDSPIYSKTATLPHAHERKTATYIEGRGAKPGEIPCKTLKLSDFDEQRRVEGPSQKPGYCVDELCSCAMHKCIPSKKNIPFEGHSNYRAEYGPKPLPPRELPTKVNLPQSLPFDADSNYRAEYGPKPLPPRELPTKVKLPQSLPFDADSSYRSEFTRKENPICQVSLLPPFPQPSYPQSHVFWDREALKWY